MSGIKNSIAKDNAKSHKEIDEAIEKAKKNIDASTAKYANAERNSNVRTFTTNTGYPFTVPNSGNPSNSGTQNPQVQNSSRSPGILGKIGGFFKAGRNRVEEESPRIAIELLLFVAIFIHFVDAKWFKFSLEPAYMAYRFPLYLTFCVLAHFIINRGWEPQDSIFTLLKWVSIPLFGVPLITWAMNLLSVPENIITTFGTIILALPIILVYVAFVRHKIAPLKGNNAVLRFFFTPSGWARIWLIAITIYIFVILLSTMGATISGGDGSLLPGDAGIISGSGVPSGIDFPTVSENLIKVITNNANKLSTSFTHLVNGTKTGFADLKNETLGSYYTGTVEQNKEQTGIFITDFHTTGKQYDSMPVVAYGYIRARSFVENVTITPSCYAQLINNKSVKFIGTVDPASLDNIYIEDQRGVLCTFDPSLNPGMTEQGGFPAGRYQVYLVLDFRFQTWAYKQYYFIDRNYLVYLKTSGENPNTKLLIPQKTKTIYTSGPVMIGMDDSIELPIPLSSENTNYLPIGMTIDNKDPVNGAKGEVLRVYNYTLRMPEAFEIKFESGNPCSINRNYIQRIPDENVPGYNLYLFTTPDVNLSGTYMTLNCNVVVEASSMQSVLPSANTPQLVSVIGTAEYDYKLSKMITITVEKTPGT
jgi:hypothetical protein